MNNFIRSTSAVRQWVMTCFGQLKITLVYIPTCPRFLNLKKEKSNPALRHNLCNVTFGWTQWKMKLISWEVSEEHGIHLLHFLLHFSLVISLWRRTTSPAINIPMFCLKQMNVMFKRTWSFFPLFGLMLNI